MSGFGLRIDADDIAKAAAGFTRGGAHKYKRRIRTMVGGKLGWKYYYDDDIERERHQKHLKAVAAKLKKLREQVAVGLASEIKIDHPDMMRARTSLKELSVEFLMEMDHWDKPPHITLSDTVMEEYHEALVKGYGDAEPEDYHGKTMSPLRAMEMGFARIPQHLYSNMPGLVTEMDVVIGAEDAFYKSHKKYAGYCSGSKISMAIDRCQANVSRAGISGGLYPVELVVHEMAHAVHNQLGARSRNFPNPQNMTNYEGYTWDDFTDFMKGEGKKEKPITAYAKTNDFERFAESFTAALMYPQDLANTCPKMYDFMRGLLGEEAMRPIHTDAEAQRKRKATLDAERKKKKPDPAKIRKIMDEMDRNVGVLDMNASDRRIQWWKEKETKVQQLLRETPKPHYESPEAAKEYHPDDKFYEMSVGGRSIMVRIGPQHGKEAKFKWTPNKGGAASGLIGGQIKEIYGEDGQPLDNYTAWWHLHQDQIGEKTILPGDEFGTTKDTDLAGLHTFESHGRSTDTPDNRTINFRFALHDVLRKLSNDKGKRTDRPVEISANTFRQRSGTFALDEWSEPGAHLIDKLRAAKTGSPAHTKLLAEYTKHQPKVAWDQITITQAHVDTGDYSQAQLGKLVNRVVTENGVPVLQAKRFINDNADGSKTIVWTQAGDPSDPATDGKFFISSPMWRELLTPHGQQIESAEGLELLCRQATEARMGDPPKARRAWMTIQTDTRGGDTGHHIHLEVEFDGRGSPLILGDKWAAKLGPNPRLESLLKSARWTPPGAEAPAETGRARINEERIKLEKKSKPLKGRDLLPEKPGDRLVLRADPDKDRGIATARDVIVRLDRIIPGRKIGEEPSPPGWDRMPDTEGIPDDEVWADEPFPFPEMHDNPQKLTKRERYLIVQGLIPDTFVGTSDQREWMKETFDPAYKWWEENKAQLATKPVEPTYIFIGEASGGAGRKKLVRHGEAAVLEDAKQLAVSRVPKPLKNHTLAYLHQRIDETTGESSGTEMRLLLPTDGSVSGFDLESISGVNVERQKRGFGREGGVTHITLSIDGFARLRNGIGGLSLTSEAERFLRSQVEDMRDAEREAAESGHAIELSDLDPLLLQKQGVGVKGILSDGTRFRLAHHQKELIQKLMDNNGRVLGAHYMGTGKTVSAIVAAKLMMAQRDPDDPTKPHPNAPKKILVVAPLNVVEQWRQASYEFDDGGIVVGAGSSDIPAAAYLAMAQAGDQNDLVFVGPEYFTANEKALREAGFDGIIVDEAHQGIKNEQTARNKALNTWEPNMKMMMLLTGTPITTSPADILEYIKMLSGGKQWAGMSRAAFIKEYLEASPIPGEAGVIGGSGPKVQIKASKREELAAIVARYTHVALAKDVRGKTLPAVRIEESEFAQMIGIQATLYAMKVAQLPPSAQKKLSENSSLGDDEMAGLSVDARRDVMAAKAISNCPAYKPASKDKEQMYNATIYSADGSVTTAPKQFLTFSVDYLKKRTDLPVKLRAAARNRWPQVDDLTEEQRGIYNRTFQHIFDPAGTAKDPVTIESLAGQKISKAQWAAMKKKHVMEDGTVLDSWDTGHALEGVRIPNPEWGPLGIRCRGISTKKGNLTEEEVANIARGQKFQRIYQNLLVAPTPTYDSNGKLKKKENWTPPTRDEAFYMAREAMNTRGEFQVPGPGEPPLPSVDPISEEEANALLATHPEIYEHSTTISHGGVTVTTADQWVSDTRGSLHLLYHPDDWDADENKPRSAGGFEKVNHNDMIDLSASKYKWAQRPKNVDPEDWEAPILIYDETQGTGRSDDWVAVRHVQENAIKWVRKADISAIVPSLMDPGRRGERDKADVAMVIGNAKAEALMAHLERFHVHTGNGFTQGQDRGRSSVIFAHGILDGCRTVEAALRVSGYRDVNEVLAGSPHHDPEDSGPSPNGKYFVTYIGSTYTGDRELNIEISKKRKDKLGRDTQESQFVHKTRTGRDWSLEPGADPHPTVKISNWTPEQRQRIKDQFKIDAPEAYHDKVVKGIVVKQYFYGTEGPITLDAVRVPIVDKVREPEWKTVRGKRVPGPLKKDPITGQTMTTPRLNEDGTPAMQSLKVKGSAGLLRAMTLMGDPSKMLDPVKAAKTRADLKTIQDEYAKLVKAGATGAKKPLTKRQTTVFNNCEIMVMSDAAQVGINKGDAVEMVMYDSLASPMAEMQRITRSARMLPPAVRDAMMNKYITEVKGVVGGDFEYAQLSADPNHPDFVKGAKRIDHLYNAIRSSGKRPPDMTYTDYTKKATDNGHKPVTVDKWNRRKPMGEDEMRDADRISWEVNGKVAIEYEDNDDKKQLTYVDKSAITETDGPFRRLRDQMEAGIFDPNRKGEPPPAIVLDASLAGESAEDVPLGEFLSKVASFAAERAEYGSKGDMAVWQSIAAKARMGANMGVASGLAIIKELKATKMPGSIKNVIDFSDTEYQAPTKGTYSIRTAAERAAGIEAGGMELEINEPVNAVKAALDSLLTATERKKIAKAGFVKQHRDPDKGETGSLDATEIYLAMRAQEIMSFISNQRPTTAAAMRAAAGGKIVTDADVMNAIIDEKLSPMDRAILKSKKYLVNVHRIGVSAQVSHMVSTYVMEENPISGKMVRRKTMAFAGYERQHPVDTERNVRAIGRARGRPVEGMYTAIQAGATYHPDTDYYSTDARDIANVSRLDPLTKALMLVFDLRKAKYTRRERKPGGGYRYFYDKPGQGPQQGGKQKKPSAAALAGEKDAVRTFLEESVDPITPREMADAMAEYGGDHALTLAAINGMIKDGELVRNGRNVELAPAKAATDAATDAAASAAVVKEVHAAVKSTRTYMSLDGDPSDTHIAFATRANGDVGSEQASRQDYDEAKRVKTALRAKFGDKIQATIEVVDEWVNLTVQIKGAE